MIFGSRPVYMYHTDGSKLEVGKVGCAFLLCTRNEIVEESQLRLTEGGDYFCSRGPCDQGSKLRSSAERSRWTRYIIGFEISASSTLLSCAATQSSCWNHKSVKGIGIELLVHCIRAHISYSYNERADALVKAAAARPSVDSHIFLSSRQVKRGIFDRDLAAWQGRWYQSGDMWFSRKSAYGDSMEISMFTKFWQDMAPLAMTKPASLSAILCATAGWGYGMIRHCVYHSPVFK